MTKLSVIVPVFNGEKFLEKCITSILGQTYRDLEILIIDDGSTDKTPQICKAFAEADPRVVVINQKNGGVSEARNVGLSRASGEFIAFVDADDFLEPQAYQEMMGVMVEKNADSCICGYFLLHPNGTKEAVPTPQETAQSIIFPLLADRLAEKPFLGTIWRYVFSAKIIKEQGLSFKGAYLEDELFIIEYFCLPHVLARVDKPLYNYFQNPESVTRRYLEGFVETFSDMMRRKADLVARFEIAAPDNWKDNCAWAGLLIAVSNEYAPGNNNSFFKRRAKAKQICKNPLFAHALKHYKPQGMSRKKSIVAAFLRYRLFFALTLLYTFKNRGR